jgi:hypothetical protein
MTKDSKPYLKPFSSVELSRDDNKVIRQTERDLKHLIPAENSSVYGV